MVSLFFVCENIAIGAKMLFNLWGFTPEYKSASDGIMLDMLLKSMEERKMAFSTNPALNQKLMQLDQEYAQQRANLIQSSYTQPQQNNSWNQNNMQQTQPPQTNQGIIWVQGEAAARSYLVAPNSTVLLMDSETSRFYLKSANNAGMPSMQIFEYSEVSQNAPQAAQSVPEDLDSKYVTREEYSRLQAQYAEIMDKLDGFRAPVLASEDSRKPTATSNKSRVKGGDSNE